MDIHQQNEKVLSHPAVRKKENTVVNRGKGRVLLQNLFILAALSVLSKVDPAGIGTSIVYTVLGVSLLKY